MLLGEVRHQFNLVVLHGTDYQIHIRERLARQYLADTLCPVPRVIDRQIQ